MIRSQSLFFFNEYLLEAKRSATCDLQERLFHFRMNRILFAAKQGWTTLRMSRPLFFGSYLQVTWWALGR